MKDSTHIFGLDHAIDVNGWIKIFRRAKKTWDETQRTEDKKLRKNIDKLVWLFRHKKGDEVVQYCKEEFEIFSLSIRIKKTKPDNFLKTMQNSQLNNFDVTSSCSCFRSLMPFKLIVHFTKICSRWSWNQITRNGPTCSKNSTTPDTKISQ